MLVERQKPVQGIFQYRLASAERGPRIDQVGCIQGSPAFFALIAVGRFIAAMRAGAGNIPVGQELLHLFIVILAGGFFNKLTPVIQLPEKIRSRLIMGF